MLGRIEVRDLDRLVEVGDQDDARISSDASAISLRGKVARRFSTSARTASAKPGDGVTSRTCAAASCSAWLSRSAATRRGVGALVGDHHQLARTGRHVDRRAAGERRHQPLGLGHPGIAGPADLVDLRDRRRRRRRARRSPARRRPSRRARCPTARRRARSARIEPAVRARRRDRDDLAQRRPLAREWRASSASRTAASCRPARKGRRGRSAATPCARSGPGAVSTAKSDGQAGLVEGRDVAGGELDRRDLLGRQASGAPRRRADATATARGASPSMRSACRRDRAQPRSRTSSTIARTAACSARPLRCSGRASAARAAGGARALPRRTASQHHLFDGDDEDRRRARGLQLLQRLPEDRFLADGVDREMAGPAVQRQDRRRLGAGQERGDPLERLTRAR